MEPLAESPNRDTLSLFLRAGALRFGSFTLKSGRHSPYFVNTAAFHTGHELSCLAAEYVRVIQEHAPEVRGVFGPAYKGIPLAVAVAMLLSTRAERTVGYLFDRKERKSHGEGGDFVGWRPQPGDALVLVDDVITDGRTKLEAIRALERSFPGLRMPLLVIAFDRQEQDAQGLNAAENFMRQSGIPVRALFDAQRLEAALAALCEIPQNQVLEAQLGLPVAAAQARLCAYRERYAPQLQAP